MFGLTIKNNSLIVDKELIELLCNYILYTIKEKTIFKLDRYCIPCEFLDKIGHFLYQSKQVTESKKPFNKIGSLVWRDPKETTHSLLEEALCILIKEKKIKKLTWYEYELLTSCNYNGDLCYVATDTEISTERIIDLFVSEIIGIEECISQKEALLEEYRTQLRTLLKEKGSKIKWVTHNDETVRKIAKTL